MRIHKFSVIVAGTFLTLSFAAAARAQAPYRISELASAGCAATSINDFGAVAGQCNATATTWPAGFPVPLGKAPGGTYSLAAGVSANGAVIGEGDLGDRRPHTLLFRQGQVINIDPSAANSHGVFINDSGVIVGNALKGFGTCNSWVAAIYVEDSSKPGTFRRTDLQPYPGGDGKVRCEFATAANQNLQVVGMMQNSLFGHLGAFWNNDAKHTLTLLQPYTGEYFTNANAINDYGQVAGESQGGAGDVINRPVMWQNDSAHTTVNLPLLSGDNYGTATGINVRGEVIGWSAYATLTPNIGYTLTPSRYVIWRNGIVTELQSLIDPAAGWTITQVFGINNRGEIVGTGLHNGQSALFVMSPQ